MGGNALKINVVRKNLIDYNIIKKYVLNTLILHIYCENICEAPEKDSFGDLDILYLFNDKINIIELINKLFKPIEIIENGPIISFDYESFQIDLIKAYNIEDFKCKKFYFSYGDFGSIVGKITNFYKLKFGDKGLWIELNNSIDDINLGIKTNIGKNLILTNQPKQICEFMGLDYSVYNSGFTTQEQLFNYIISSKYYNKCIFQINNSKDKKNIKVRQIYNNFIKYINKNKEEILIIEKQILIVEKQKIQQYAINYFNKNLELEILTNNVKLNEIRKIKYNGKLFIEKGFINKDINEYMKKFEEFIEKKYQVNFNEWLDLIDDIKIELNNFLII
jgi:hypothetical protein